MRFKRRGRRSFGRSRSRGRRRYHSSRRGSAGRRSVRPRKIGFRM